jgi:hypothetical protein
MQQKEDRMRAIRRPKHPAIEKGKGIGERKPFWKTADPATAKGFESFYT